MIRYAKGAAPARLTALAASPTTDWDGLGAADKQPVREALVRDQGALCAYCQRRIDAGMDARTGRPRMKVEHWAARSTAGRQQLQWSNMLGVCWGGAPGTPDAGATAVDRHCDESRGSRVLFLHPVEGQGPDPRAHLRYTKNGVVEYARPLPAGRDDIEALQLNAPRLKRAREEIYATEIVERLRRLMPAEAVRELNRIAKRHEMRAGTAAPVHAEFVGYQVRKKLERMAGRG